MSSTTRISRTTPARKGSGSKRNGKAKGDQLEFLASAPSKAPRRAPAASTPKRKGNGAAAPAQAVLSVDTEPVIADTPRRGRQPKVARRQTAQDMANRQREISVSEFFTKNRHLLGFDNLHKALLTTVREAVDNALDACEEAGILPQVAVAIQEVSEDRYIVTVEDNGPGIVKAQLPKIFGKLLYGSKFHRLKQSRGQQGIGISAAAMYGQITTGRPITIISKTGHGRDVHRLEQQIDTIKNQPVVLSDQVLTDDTYWNEKESGTLVQIELQASFKGGQHSVESYLRQTALANPHTELAYVPPKGPALRFARVVSQAPEEAQEIQPHPHGVELGILMRMLKEARGLTVRQFLVQSFSRVSDKVAGEILATAQLGPRTTTSEVHRQHVEALYQAIQATKIMAPPTSCLSPIGVEAIQRGMLALLHADQTSLDEVGEELVDQIVATAEVDPDSGIETQGMFVTAVTRPPAVYRGNPFQVEVGIAYGKALPADQLARVFRFANRVPLLYQQSACAMTKSVMQTAWRNYDIPQSRGALPTAPMLVMVHIASAWVPYTSESKEAIAHYPEILRELKLALQEAGRRLAIHVRRRRREADEEKKAKYIHKYIDPIGEALQEILGLSQAQTQVTVQTIREILERSRKL
ncbi:MAG: DNA topoisomerase VI subunit B [Pseudomonadota bacterium]